MINRDELIFNTKGGDWCLKRSLKIKSTTNWKSAIKASRMLQDMHEPAQV